MGSRIIYNTGFIEERTLFYFYYFNWNIIYFSK